jgi:hypothetical protein
MAISLYFHIQVTCGLNENQWLRFNNQLKSFILKIKNRIFSDPILSHHLRKTLFPSSLENPFLFFFFFFLFFMISAIKHGSFRLHETHRTTEVAQVSCQFFVVVVKFHHEVLDGVVIVNRDGRRTSRW